MALELVYRMEEEDAGDESGEGEEEQEAGEEGQRHGGSAYEEEDVETGLMRRK